MSTVILLSSSWLRSRICGKAKQRIWTNFHWGLASVYKGNIIKGNDYLQFKVKKTLKSQWSVSQNIDSRNSILFCFRFNVCISPFYNVLRCFSKASHLFKNQTKLFLKELMRWWWKGIAYQPSLGFDQGSVLAVHFVVESACIAEIVARSVAPPQWSRSCSTVYTLPTL